MDQKLILEIVGYIGSVFVVVSMLMTSVVKLRLINMIGSVISIIYAAIVHAYPLALMNFCLVVINSINLYKLLNTKRVYSVLKLSFEDGFIRYFLDTYGEDIKKFFPDANFSESYEEAYLVCCGTTPAGILLGKKLSDSTIDIFIDYATPAYRDCSVGKHLYNYINEQDHISEFTFSKNSVNHKPYLYKIGFKDVDGKLVKKF
ncbi:YgjV family protein [uncultured Treponema sp.]|uniref:YgjV family protein n=1 Tax=uncultured Treponema sp. TaxID=162155 RepID=UPI0025E1B702|nr:YgjV family protein [uncultured Treponema sp.]